MPLTSDDVTAPGSLPGIPAGTVQTTDQLYIVRPGSLPATPLYIGTVAQVASAMLPFFSFTASTGLSGGTVASGGTVSITATGVEAGTYANPVLTVNAEGQITEIENGSPGFFGGTCDEGALGPFGNNIFDIEMLLDGGGTVLPVTMVRVTHVDFACKIMVGTLDADQSGSIEIDVWVAPRSDSSQPTVANSITGSAPLKIISNWSSQDSTLTGWSQLIPANSSIAFNINSVTAHTWVNICLGVLRT